MSEVITIGEPLTTFTSTDPDLSLVDATNFTKIAGGAELNVAIGVKRLGHSVEYISSVGTDPFGQYVTKMIKKHGVGTRYISTDPEHWTGHQIKNLVTHGDPEIYYYRRGSAAAHLKAETIDQVDLTGVKHAHMTGIFPAISDDAEEAVWRLFSRLIDANIQISFDPNIRPALWASVDKMKKDLNEFASKADIFLPGVNEAKLLMGSDDPEEIADFYLKGERTKIVIVKIGPAGAYFKTKDGLAATVAGFSVEKVVDTVGAGDGFALGVITALLEGKTLKSAVMRGNAVGSLQVQTHGDNDGYPTHEQLEAFYAAKGVNEQ